MKLSIVDTPDFVGFNDELKSGIREAESMLQRAVEPLLAAFPEPLQPAIAPIISQWPIQFLISQLPLYRHVDSLYRTHQRLIDGNPAALPKQ